VLSTLGLVEGCSVGSSVGKTDGVRVVGKFDGEMEGMDVGSSVG
jgi:hypothetical protein